MQDNRSELAEDLLVGAEAIARFLGCSERRVYHCAEIGSLPIHKQEGWGLVASTSALKQHFADLDAAFEKRKQGG